MIINYSTLSKRRQTFPKRFGTFFSVKSGDGGYICVQMLENGGFGGRGGLGMTVESAISALVQVIVGRSQMKGLQGVTAREAGALAASVGNEGAQALEVELCQGPDGAGKRTRNK